MLAIKIFMIAALVLLGLVQILGIVIALSSKYDGRDWKNFQKENNDGTISIKVTAGLVEWILITIGMTILVLRKKDYVKYLAKTNAQDGEYKNRFKKKSFKKAYDKVYLAKRKEIIEKKVIDDAVNSRTTSTFLNDTEKALYQNLYLQKMTGQENAKNLLERRAEELYATIEFESVESHIFDQIVAQEAH